jgi:hypothetical protein
MARWRKARSPAAAAARPTGRAEPAAPPVTTPAAGQPPALPVLDAARAERMHRALRLAVPSRAPQTEDARLQPAAARHGAAFSTVLAEGPNLNAIGMQAERGSAAARRGPASGGGLREVAARLRLRALAIAGSTAGAGRALRRVLDDRIGQARRQLGAAGRALAVAAPGLGHAIRSVRGFGEAARGGGAAAWRALDPALHHGILAARRRGGAVLAAAGRAAMTDRLALAGAAVIAVALAGWLLAPRDRPAPPRATPAPEIARARDDAAAAPVPPQPAAVATAPQPPPLQASAQALQAPAPDATSARPAARLKPVLAPPPLTVRLKPPVSGAPDPESSSGAPADHGDPRAVDSRLKQMFSGGGGLARATPPRASGRS